MCSYIVQYSFCENHDVSNMINFNFQTVLALSNQIITMSMSASYETAVTILLGNVFFKYYFEIFHNFTLVERGFSV